MKAQSGWVVIVGIVCVTALEITAITSGMNGATFGTALAAITGLVGYSARLFQEKRKESKESERRIVP